jgi:hypothetical protein
MAGHVPIVSTAIQGRKRQRAQCGADAVDATCAWDIYRAARRGRWIGRVIAVDAGEAIEAAAVVFNTDVRRLIAVRIWEA